MNKMSLLYLCFYSVQMFLLERSVSNGATPKVSLSHCILVLFWYQSHDNGTERAETQRADLHP